MFGSIWNRIKQSIKKPTITSVPLPNSNNQPGRSNPQQVGNVISAYDVQSWAPDIHSQRERSTLVKDIDYMDGKLDVTYNDGFTAEYDNISPDEVKDFVQDESKGRWAKAHLWNKPYKKVK